MKEILFSWIKKNVLVIFLMCGLSILKVTFLVVMFFNIGEQFVGQLLGLSEKNEILTFVGLGMGGVLVALQAVMSYKRAKAIEETAKSQAAAASAQARATEEQATANKNTEKGQRQERLKNAIEHLGHDSDSVRLGGAYELFHVAQDTKELRQTVLDILCAHIRQTTREDKYRQSHAWKPSEEVQSLLTLLFVDAHDVFQGLHIKLQRSWLNGSDLRGARLEKGDMTGAHLKRANLGEADIRGAHLNKTQLQGADLYRVCLQEAGLRNAHLYNSNLEAAKLQCTMLSGARLVGSDLSYAHLHGAVLFDMEAGGAQLQGAILRYTELHAADLRAVNMQGVGSEPYDTFAQRMRRSIVQSDLRLAIFSGGLRSTQDVDSRVKGLSDEAAQMLRVELEEHIGQRRSHNAPEDSGVVIGKYSEDEAEKWIDEYREAMSDVSKPDDG